MDSKKIGLASDNSSSAHPLIIQALMEANVGYAPSYGADLWTSEAIRLIQEAFKAECQVFMVPTGTGANVLGLMLSCGRHESVICTDIAHIQYQESGAAESIVGCKLLGVPHKDGKITPESIVMQLKSERAFGKHSTSPRVLAIAQPTELGTVYSLSELQALSTLCREENLLLHMDGSRLYNAAAALEADLHEMASSAQCDTLTLGGTKNGLIGAEALLIFNPKLEEGAEHLQKQTLQLVSKMRYFSAQYIPYFKNELWRPLATQANQKAQEIASVIEAFPELSLSYPVETNQIFFTAKAPWIPLIQEKIFCYPWGPGENQIRFIASWNTSEKDVKDLKSIFSKIASKRESF